MSDSSDTSTSQQQEQQGGPTMDPAVLLEKSRYSYASALISAMTFGMYLILAYQSIRLLLKRHRRQGGYAGMLLYSLFMLSVTVVWFCVGAKWSSVDFLEGATNPAVFETLQCSPLGIAKDVFATFLVWTSDGLMLWRTWVIWERNPFVIAIPALTYLSVIGTGLALNMLCSTSLTFTPSQYTTIPTAFWSLSVSLNVLTTLLVATKLLAHRRQMLRLGVAMHDSVREYTSVVGILAESATLYALTGVIYIALFTHNVPVADPFSTIFAAASYLCPALIQLRVAQGVAYTSRSNPSGTISEMEFGKDTEAQQGDSAGSSTARGASGGTVNASHLWNGDKRSGKSAGSSEALPTVEKTPSRTE